MRLTSLLRVGGVDRSPSASSLSSFVHHLLKTQTWSLEFQHLWVAIKKIFVQQKRAQQSLNAIEVLKMNVFHLVLLSMWQSVKSVRLCVFHALHAGYGFQTVTSSAFVIRSSVTEGDKRDVYICSRISFFHSHDESLWLTGYVQNEMISILHIALPARLHVKQKTLGVSPFTHLAIQWRTKLASQFRL